MYERAPQFHIHKGSILSMIIDIRLLKTNGYLNVITYELASCVQIDSSSRDKLRS